MNYATVVIRMPDEANARKQIQEGLRLLEPFRTAMSSEDEMSILELIEQHEDFPGYIAQEARDQVAQLHAAYEETKPVPDVRLIQAPESDYMIVARRRDGTVEAAGWDGPRTRFEAWEWLQRGLTLEYVSAQTVRELLATYPGGVFDTTESVGAVLDRELAEKEMRRI